MPNIPLAKAIPFVAAAYMGIWLIAFVYLLVMGNRLSQLYKEVKTLSQIVGKKNKEQ